MSQVTGPSNTPKTSVGHGPQTKESQPDEPNTKSQPSSGNSPSTETKETTGRVQVEVQNPKGPSEADIRKARENPDSLFALGLARNPNFTPSVDDINFARKNPKSFFAWGLAQNPNFKPSDDDIKFARENPNSGFGSGLALNPNLKTKL